LAATKAAAWSLWVKPMTPPPDFGSMTGAPLTVRYGYLD